MKQNLTFAVILLAMLFMINATPLHERKTKTNNFKRCNNLPGLDVKVSPNPVQAGKDATFTVSGDFHDHPLHSSGILSIYFDYDNSTYICKDVQFFQPVCSDDSSESSDKIKTKCPVTDYKDTMTVQIPDDLPTNDYFITVMVIDNKSGVANCEGADVDYVQKCTGGGF